MNETTFYEVLEHEPGDSIHANSKSESSIKKVNTKRAGILGCGAIAQILTNFAEEEKLNINLKCFYDRYLERADVLAARLDGVVARDLNDMLEQVDLVIETASPQAVVENVPQILNKGKDVVIMSIGALMNQKFRHKLEDIASKNNSKIYTPSGAIAGLDGIKAASIGNITEAKLITRKPPQSLGVSTSKEIVLYEGKASDAVKKFPVNINVAAALSLACGKEVDVKIIADPSVKSNCHQVHVAGDFGEFKTITQNKSCASNPKTSILAAYSIIELINNNLKPMINLNIKFNNFKEF